MNANRWTPNRRVSAATTRPWHARKRWSNATMTSSARIGPRYLDHADFHVAVLQIQAGTRSCDLGRLIQRGGVDDENATDGVLRLDERPVDHRAAANGQSAAGLIMELVGAHEPAAVAQALNPRHVAFEHDGSQFGIVSRAFINVGAAGDQHELWHQRFSEESGTVARNRVSVGRVDQPASQVRINRVRTAMAAFKVSLQADKIEPPTRCRAGKAIVCPLEATVGKRQHGVAAVRPQIERDSRSVERGQPRRDHLPAHMGLRRELVYLDLDDELMLVETEFTGTTDRRIKGSVACPPVPSALGGGDRLINPRRGGVDFDEMHDVVHSAVPFGRSNLRSPARFAMHATPFVRLLPLPLPRS